MKPTFLILLALLLVAATLPAQGPKGTGKGGPAPEFETTGTLHQVMRAIMLPNSDIVFEAGNEPPTTDEGWLKAQNAALTLAEAGNLLMIGGRSQGRPDWTQLAKGLIAAGQKAYKAAMAKDPDQMLIVGGDLTDACAACHNKYRDNQ